VATDLFAERRMHCKVYFSEGSIEAMFIMYEGQSENDPDNYALFSLERMSLEEHQNRKNFRDNRARRHKKTRDRLILMLWTVFARSEGRVLFGDLRIKVEWEHLEKKLCIERKVKKKKAKLAIDWYFFGDTSE